MNKKIIRRYPFFSIFLLLLACIKFQYNAPTWSWSIPGLNGGFVVLCLIIVVLLFRMFNVIQDILVVYDIVPSRITCKYDILIPIGILVVAIKGHWFGHLIEIHGKSVRQWEFYWSDSTWDSPFIGVLIALVLLLRIYTLLQEIVAYKRKRGSGEE